MVAGWSREWAGGCKVMSGPGHLELLLSLTSYRDHPGHKQIFCIVFMFPYWYPTRLHTKLNETANDNEIFFFASIFNSDKLLHNDCINKKEEISSTSGGREWGMDWAFGQTRSGQILSDFGSVLPPVFKFSLAVAHLNTSQQRPLAWSWPWHMIIFDEFSG